MLSNINQLKKTLSYMKIQIEYNENISIQFTNFKKKMIWETIKLENDETNKTKSIFC